MTQKQKITIERERNNEQHAKFVQLKGHGAFAYFHCPATARRHRRRWQDNNRRRETDDDNDGQSCSYTLLATPLSVVMVWSAGDAAGVGTLNMFEAAQLELISADVSAVEDSDLFRTDHLFCYTFTSLARTVSARYSRSVGDKGEKYDSSIDVVSHFNSICVARTVTKTKVPLSDFLSRT